MVCNTAWYSLAWAVFTGLPTCRLGDIWCGQYKVPNINWYKLFTLKYAKKYLIELSVFAAPVYILWN